MLSATGMEFALVPCRSAIEVHGPTAAPEMQLVFSQLIDNVFHRVSEPYVTLSTPGMLLRRRLRVHGALGGRGTVAPAGTRLGRVIQLGTKATESSHLCRHQLWTPVV
jgi:hypothetical protein